MKKSILQTFFLGMFLLFAVASFAQVNVTGTVKSDEGELLPGVSIVEKGTGNGVITDLDGNYSISVPNGQASLVFSFVGMQTQEVQIDGRSVIDVTLATSSIGVDEVVVTALGISREKKSLGYSVGEVEGENLQKVAQENVLNALSGKVAGVTINSTGGPGSSVSMVIRGASSLTSDNQPLFVVDGIPMNNTLNNVTAIGRDNKPDYGNAISDINADDIESISVLKGPSAAALYGSRAGNGVVLITTKSGKKTQGLGVTITSNTVIDNPYKYLEKHTLFANGQRPFTQDDRPNNGLDYYAVPVADSYWVGPELDNGMMAYQWPYFDENGQLEATPLVSHPDNYKEFFETGITSTNTISINDSNEKLDYRISYSNMQNKGIIPNSDLHKNSIGLNSTIKLLDNLSVSSSINFVSNGADNRPSTGNRGTNPLQALYDINSSIDINDLKNYWEPGKEGIQQNAPYNLEVNSDGTYGKGDMINNPYFIANEVNNSFQRDRVFGNARVDYDITKEWSLMARYTHDQFHEKRETKIAPSYTGDANGVYGLENLYRREQNADFLLAYKKTMDAWSFNASAGGNYMYQFAENNLTATKDRGSGLIVPGVYNIGNIAPDNLRYTSGMSEKAIYSLYGLASIGYKDAVYLDLTARNDWSSTLPEENRSYFYPSASLSMLLNNMFEMGSNVSLAKLRGGWAMVGNDTDPYKLMATMVNSGLWGNQIELSTSGTLLLPDLKPEIQTSWEIGADLAFFDNRIRFEGTYYEAENENQILNIGLPPSSGYTGKQINAGLISSKGIEFSLGGTPVRTKDLNWDVNFVFSKNRTRVEELADGFDYIVLWTDAKGGAVTRVGDEIGQIVDDILVRVEDESSPYYGWPIIDDEGWDDADNWENYMEPGDNTAVIGNFNPDFMVGMQTSLTYKNWTLSASLDWRVGGQFVSQTFRYGESDLHTKRWIDRTLKLNGMSGAEMAEYLIDHADEYLSPDGEFFVVVGGPTAEYGGLPHTEDGITLNDGVFMPGVEGYYDENGKFVMVKEHLGGDGTPTIRYQDFYGWGYTRNAMFDADFIKLREISLSYQLPPLKSIGINNASISVYSRNILLWTKAGIGIDPETAFQAESSNQGSGIQFKQGIERYNVRPWTIPVGIKLNVSF
ncbi:SusC/RagA family TonB-linked outer membrane protein [Maribellus comscasis]|uniref:SusC/RagA family TonB-linked outer membrane protein n=1 Tax=Maribellus comscasis TaxID=2681766 RepID=A0A6I6KAT2_9BACT|nr:SusC/RagA family TonB-linked outer membrane protein [Maribellus comscasis]QGY47304.1 SusC/RagA family TonB-linked outer membrane protein [Maribellus comscasis]